MDRFIGYTVATDNIAKFDLKSNMDRFIATAPYMSEELAWDLKSNMDRFIVLEVNKVVGTNRI